MSLFAQQNQPKSADASLSGKRVAILATNGFERSELFEPKAALETAGADVRIISLKGGEINEAKKALATEATALLHGRDAANTAAETARQTFEEGAIAASLPTVEIPSGELEAGAGVVGLFVKAGLVASNGEARRQIKGGGLRVNDAVVTDEKTTWGCRAARDFQPNRACSRFFTAAMKRSANRNYRWATN